eukprot:CRZ12914.1 hypothetical protein [Spongospora subterranea]
MLIVAVGAILLACYAVEGGGESSSETWSESMTSTHTTKDKYSTSSSSTSACTRGNYLIPTDECGNPIVVPFCDAAAVCRDACTVGVAAADTDNLKKLGKLTAFCLVRGAWVESWNGDTYGGSPLYVTRKSPGPGYSVEADITRALEFPVICQIAY